MTLTQESAETLGLEAVAWLAGNDDLLPVFMGSTGASEDDIREALEDPYFQGAVLDFLMMDDAWLTAFCDARGFAYEMPRQARAALPGGRQVDWT